MAFWEGRRVLVTGATGFLGGWIVAELARQGASVVALYRRPRPGSVFVEAGWIGRVTGVRAGLDDPALLRRIVTGWAVETVFHLAAHSQAGAGLKAPAAVLEDNARAVWNLLEAVRSRKGCQVVLASSQRVCRPGGPYDVSKICAEIVSQMYAASFSVPVAIARCSNIYGGGDLNVGRVIPGLVTAGLVGEPFTIRNGRALSDFLYVDDAVQALLFMAEAMAAEDALSGYAWRVAHDSPRAVSQVARLAWALMGRAESDLHILDNGDEQSGHLEGAKEARPLPGWAPYTEIEEGLEKTIHWYACNSARPRSCAAASAPL